MSSDGINHSHIDFSLRKLDWIMCILQLFTRIQLTASISFRAFHCSYWTPRASAVWMVLFMWLVHTFRSRIFWPLMKAAKAFAYWNLKQEPLWSPLTEIGLDLGDCFRTGIREDHLLSSRWEAWISPNTSQQVEFTLSVAAQVDGSRCDVDVH